MKQHPLLFGLVFALLAYVGSSVYVFPNVQWLSMAFSWAGTFAGALFGGVIFLITFVVVFWAVHKTGISTELPEASQ